MKNQVLSIYQMQHLNLLGVDTSKASMCWIKNTDGTDEENKYMVSIHNEWCYELPCLSPVQTFTLQDILETLPTGCSLKQYEDDLWECKYYTHENGGNSCFDSSPIEAAYRLLVWATENNHLKTK